jgi:hypothetical protein
MGDRANDLGRGSFTGVFRRARAADRDLAVSTRARRAALDLVIAVVVVLAIISALICSGGGS